MIDGFIVQWEILIGFGIPAIVAMVGGLRYFWSKEKLFIEMKNKINQLSDDNSSSSNIHDTLYQKYNDVSNRLSNVEGKLALICKHFKISV